MIQVKTFDEEHEKDLEKAVNNFLQEINSKNLIDIKYCVAVDCINAEDQVYCYSAMVIYTEEKDIVEV